MHQHQHSCLLATHHPRAARTVAPRRRPLQLLPAYRYSSNMASYSSTVFNKVNLLYKSYDKEDEVGYDSSRFLATSKYVLFLLL